MIFLCKPPFTPFSQSQLNNLSFYKFCNKSAVCQSKFHLNFAVFRHTACFRHKGRHFTGSKAYAAVCGKLASQPVQVHTARGGSFRLNALRAQPGNNARKHIAAASGCHGRRTGCVNIHRAVRAADNRRRVLSAPARSSILRRIFPQVQCGAHQPRRRLNRTNAPFHPGAGVSILVHLSCGRISALQLNAVSASASITAVPS